MFAIVGGWINLLGLLSDENGKERISFNLMNDLNAIMLMNAKMFDPKFSCQLKFFVAGVNFGSTRRNVTSSSHDKSNSKGLDLVVGTKMLLLLIF